MKSNPRILFFTAYYHPFLGGVETITRQIVNYLHERGFPVMVLTKKYDKDSPRLGQVDGVDVYRIPPSGPRSNLRKWLLIVPATCFMLWRNRDFDMIVCEGYQGIGIAAIIAGKILRKPVVFKSGNLGVLSCRNWDPLLKGAGISPGGMLARGLKAAVQKIYLRADAFICIAREIEEEALGCGVPRDRVFHLPNAVNTERYRPPDDNERREIREEEGWPDDATICIYVGRLSVEKGILDLIEAWRQIEDRKAMLIVIGPDMPGHEMDAGPLVRERIEEYHLHDRVLLFGGREDVWRLLRGADIFIQPSHYEAFGISVIEAMASGLPVVATAVGGMLDYLSDGENALLCMAKSPDDLRDKIARLIADRPLSQRLAAAALRTVEENYRENVVFDRFAELFSNIHNRSTGHDQQ